MEPTVSKSAEELEAIQPKERPLVLDPIVVATFGQLAQQLETYFNSVCRVTGYTSQSRQRSCPDGSRT